MQVRKNTIINNKHTYLTTSNALTHCFYGYGSKWEWRKGLGNKNNSPKKFFYTNCLFVCFFSIKFYTTYERRENKNWHQFYHRLNKTNRNFVRVYNEREREKDIWIYYSQDMVNMCVVWPTYSLHLYKVFCSINNVLDGNSVPNFLEIDVNVNVNKMVFFLHKTKTKLHMFIPWRIYDTQ